MQQETVYRKIYARLRAYGVNKLSVRHRVTEAIVQQAHLTGDDDSFELRATEIFEDYQERIIVVVTASNDFENNADAILALQRADVTAIWQAAIDSEEKLNFVVQQFPTAPLINGPELTRSSLGAPRIQFGMVEETTNSTLAVLSRWPTLRYTGILILLIGLLTVIFFIAR